MHEGRLNLATARAFLGRLARDVRANTLAIMTVALIPLAGMVGGGVDISRMYIVKTRLQHACDAGALAGRKAMGGGVWNFNNYYARTQAERFFDANYNASAYGVTARSRAFSENAGKVSGTASADLPMTLMRIFGKTSETLSVTCDAEMRLPNTDVMFVLDVTGSMGSKAVSTDSDTKINSLKTAVKCFYEIVARLDTDANCTTGAPSGGTGSQVQLRFGFVPYSTNVNVGKLLPTSFLANSWDYQSRVKVGMDWSAWRDNRYHSKTNNSCVPQASNATTQYQSSATGRSGNNACLEQVRNYVPQWKYDQISTNISGLKNGTLWNNSFTMPLNNDGSNRSITWDGCIEERRPTVRQSNYYPIPSGANDLNIDLMPSQGDSTTLWGPALPALIYARSMTSSWSQLDATPTTSTDNYYNSIPYYCPAEAKKLQQWPSADAFDNYVDSLYPTGNTYHDIGILWGARFMSPTGIFGTENAYTPQGGAIERHMSCMTDGDAVSAPCDYTAYGVGFFDKRTTTDVGSASSCANERQSFDDQVNARFTALCTAVKNKNITLWVISFGSGSNATTEGRLQTCASDGRYFTARNSAALQQTFKTIADQISQLRLTK